MLPFGVLGVFLVGDAQVQISEIEELFNGLKENATSFASSLFLSFPRYSQAPDFLIV